MTQKKRLDVAILRDGHIFTGYPLHTKYIHRLAFVVMSKGNITFELHCHNGDILFSESVNGTKTITIEDPFTHSEFLTPVVKRDDPCVSTAFFIDAIVKHHKGDFGLDDFNLFD